MSKKNIETLSEKANKRFYQDKNFKSLFFSAIQASKGKCHFFIVSGLFLIISVLLKFKYPTPFVELLNIYNDTLFNFSLTVISFLLVSFSILLGVGNNRSVFTNYRNTDNEYKMPLLKALLLHFILPAGIYLLLFILTFIIKILLPFERHFNLSLLFKVSIIKTLIFLYSTLTYLCIVELISYFYNITQFIFISNYFLSSDYESDLINKIFVTKEKISKIEEDDAKEIERNILDQK